MKQYQQEETFKNDDKPALTPADHSFIIRAMHCSITHPSIFTTASDAAVRGGHYLPAPCKSWLKLEVHKAELFGLACISFEYIYLWIYVVCMEVVRCHDRYVYYCCNSSHLLFYVFTCKWVARHHSQ